MRIPQRRFTPVIAVAAAVAVTLSAQQPDSGRPHYAAGARMLLDAHSLIVVKDGQATEISVGSDRVTGETLRARLTITALK